MSAPTPAVKAKWRKKHKSWSAELTPEEFAKLKQIQGGLSNAEYLKKIIEYGDVDLCTEKEATTNKKI